MFENLTLHINEGQKVALVARNGAGKSSLMNLIIGVESPDSGSIMMHKSVKAVFLEQDPKLPEHLSVFDAVYLSENPVMKAVAAYDKAMLKGESGNELTAALAEMDRLNAWDYEAKIHEILSRLKISHLDQPLGVLSGGQRKRVALAKVLIDQPDFIILDEPTNHLDLEMIEWLEEYLAQPGLTLFMVTHDRYFLESVCDQIVELDGGELFKYQGSYSYYLQKKAEREESLASTTAKARNTYVRELDWMRKQPKARGTKAKSRIDAFFEVEKKAKRRLDEDEMLIEIQMNRLGSKIIELHNVSKAYGNQVILGNFDYKFKPKDRVGIVGKNGAGKSTLLNIMTGRETPDTGKSITGDSVVLGYYTQEDMNLPTDKRVIDVIRDIAEFIPLKGVKRLYAHQLLERFLFEPRHQQTFVYKLSGGEKRRLYLLTILMKNPNVLILDEPTNDLDVATLQVLEEFLHSYEGVLIIVSHDRHFMDKLVEHTFVFEGNGVVNDFPGNYSAYREAKLLEKATAPKPTATTSTTTAITPAAKKQVDSKELKKIEKELANLESRKKELTAQFDNPALTPEQITKLSKELGDITNAIEEKEMQWMDMV